MKKTPLAFEIGFDGLVGPTHSYAGLSYGNVASLSNKAIIAHPMEAALQGLKKMSALTEMGLKQAILPPQERPDVAILRKLGFTGRDHEVIEKAGKRAPEILAACSSASAMWTANAGTMSPSADSRDRKAHFTAANLFNKLHRSIEAPTTARIFRKIFSDPSLFVHHPPLPPSDALGDEGAANHSRFCRVHGERGVQFFVYGRSALETEGKTPRRFPARQTLEASQAIARLHELAEEATVFAQQNPEAIDAGAFHNDVVAVGHLGVLFYHERAFAHPAKVLGDLKDAVRRVCGIDLTAIEVKDEEVSLALAVKSYLFNSQLVSLPQGGMALIAPQECEEVPEVRLAIERIVESGGPIQSVRYFQLRQSMQNGGGPACLRFRVVLNEGEIQRTAPGIFIDRQKIEVLEQWVRRHYRDRLKAEDLRDPSLLEECRRGLEELTQILGLGSIYPFQLGVGENH